MHTYKMISIFSSIMSNVQYDLALELFTTKIKFQKNIV